jgi:hypothetical protein
MQLEYPKDSRILPAWETGTIHIAMNRTFIIGTETCEKYLNLASSTNAHPPLSVLAHLIVIKKYPKKDKELSHLHKL